MNMSNVYLVTCESVTEGHPDKLCDQISDAILDDILGHDPVAHVGIEVMATKGKVIISGEVKTKYMCNYRKVARRVMLSIGYSEKDIGSPSDIEVRVHEQSPDVSNSIERSNGVIGAGDQGIVYGYATSETIRGLPLPYVIATNLTRVLDISRHDKMIPIRPDGKVQVTVAYDRVTKEPQYIDTVIVSVQHNESVDVEYLRDVMKNFILQHLSVFPIFRETDLHQMKLYINPSGKFTVGGPAGDVGLTGRKIAVDTYGGLAHDGGGSFSGKDPTKIDRSGAYMARYVAKHIIGTGFVRDCEVAISYAIGKVKPVHISVRTNDPKKDAVFEKIVGEVFDLTPAGIINTLYLRSTRYLNTAVHGHFTSPNMPWEIVDPVKVEVISSLYDTYTR